MDSRFLKWLTLVRPTSDVVPAPDRYIVYTDCVDEADDLWRSRYLLGKPLEIIIGRRYTPSVELQKTW
ncbi:MAG: hypothetical protein KME12_23465 [Trichocoleus desertorum ATA4-8-CV12]|jgi:hypothetical protein|nr:hypothetical protein [Trichocoleus desertorum ATA4-8-CV12]